AQVEDIVTKGILRGMLLGDRVLARVKRLLAQELGTEPFSSLSSSGKKALSPILAKEVTKDLWGWGEGIPREAALIVEGAVLQSASVPQYAALEQFTREALIAGRIGDSYLIGLQLLAELCVRQIEMGTKRDFSKIEQLFSNAALAVAFGGNKDKQALAWMALARIYFAAYQAKHLTMSQIMAETSNEIYQFVQSLEYAQGLARDPGKLQDLANQEKQNDDAILRQGLAIYFVEQALETGDPSLVERFFGLEGRFWNEAMIRALDVAAVKLRQQGKLSYDRKGDDSLEVMALIYQLSIEKGQTPREVLLNWVIVNGGPVWLKSAARRALARVGEVRVLDSMDVENISSEVDLETAGLLMAEQVRQLKAGFSSVEGQATGGTGQMQMVGAIAYSHLIVDEIKAGKVSKAALLRRMEPLVSVLGKGSAALDDVVIHSTARMMAELVSHGHMTVEEISESILDPSKNASERRAAIVALRMIAGMKRDDGERGTENGKADLSTVVRAPSSVPRPPFSPARLGILRQLDIALEDTAEALGGMLKILDSQGEVSTPSGGIPDGFDWKGQNLPVMEQLLSAQIKNKTGDEATRIKLMQALAKVRAELVRTGKGSLSENDLKEQAEKGWDDGFIALLTLSNIYAQRKAGQDTAMLTQGFKDDINWLFEKMKWYAHAVTNPDRAAALGAAASKLFGGVSFPDSPEFMLAWLQAEVENIRSGKTSPTLEEISKWEDAVVRDTHLPFWQALAELYLEAVRQGVLSRADLEKKYGDYSNHPTGKGRTKQEKEAVRNAHPAIALASALALEFYMKDDRRTADVNLDTIEKGIKLATPEVDVVRIRIWSERYAAQIEGGEQLDPSRLTNLFEKTKGASPEIQKAVAEAVDTLYVAQLKAHDSVPQYDWARTELESRVDETGKGFLLIKSRAQQILVGTIVEHQVMRTLADPASAVPVRIKEALTIAETYWQRTKKGDDVDVSTLLTILSNMQPVQTGPEAIARLRDYIAMI
ncbi:MAG TPA: hypothetical protein VLJ10_01330, partial [Candidatus Bathyarchaeia archaeon]|nr:hypothetical protein [Candidatus Bathyarchaeia archaeon]